jgi:hypothetical protein
VLSGTCEKELQELRQVSLLQIEVVDGCEICCGLVAGCLRNAAVPENSGYDSISDDGLPKHY